MTIEINDLEDADLIQDLNDTELEVLVGGSDALLNRVGELLGIPLPPYIEYLL